MRRPLTVPDYVGGVLAGDRAVIARAITLVESKRTEHRELAQQMLVELLPHAGGSHRVGITGVPGVGKSTFIDAFGTDLTAAGHRVAVLAVDPTSSRTGGSILGDKTRMARLAVDPSAYIRPSPSGGTLGGVTRTTRETMVVIEAAGYDVVLVETVGVGQSETIVADMVDFFLVLMLPGAGDELQGIKKGILELADLVAVNKADGDNRARATASASDYAAAIHLVTAPSAAWQPPVVVCSGLTGDGLTTIWDHICRHREVLTTNGSFHHRREEQQVRWMWAMVEERLGRALRTVTAGIAPGLEADVRAGRATATLAADRLLDAFERAGAEAAIRDARRTD